MNNAEEMREHLPEIPPLFRKAGMKRCYQCDDHFGLVRQRLAKKAFCSKRYLNQ